MYFPFYLFKAARVPTTMNDKPYTITMPDKIFTGREAFINVSTACIMALTATIKTKTRISIPVRTRGIIINTKATVSSKKKTLGRIMPTEG